jgi:adenosylhomocysteine nucleosidase
MKIGIMGAMAEEVSQLRHHMTETQSESRGMREYVTGELHGKSVTLVFSRWGKVAASSTATTLVERYGVDCLVFTGVAGALDPALNVGDIVVADTLVQHDMDASVLPGIEKFEIPLLGVARFKVDESYVSAARSAAEAYLAENLRGDVSSDVLDEFHISAPQVATGTIASGDQFIADDKVVQRLRGALPGLRCVEMEGAAVAQVAHEHSIPCVVLRTISDKADHSAVVDFPQFVAKIASHFTCGSVLHLVDLIGN